MCRMRYTKAMDWLTSSRPVLPDTRHRWHCVQPAQFGMRLARRRRAWRCSIRDCWRYCRPPSPDCRRDRPTSWTSRSARTAAAGWNRLRRPRPIRPALPSSMQSARSGAWWPLTARRRPKCGNTSLSYRRSTGSWVRRFSFRHPEQTATAVRGSRSRSCGGMAIKQKARHAFACRAAHFSYGKCGSR